MKNRYYVWFKNGSKEIFHRNYTFGSLKLARAFAYGQFNGLLKNIKDNLLIAIYRNDGVYYDEGTCFFYVSYKRKDGCFYDRNGNDIDNLLGDIAETVFKL